MNNGKFFNKKISPACNICKNGRIISGGKEVFCLKKGIMSATDSCRFYKYDVLKRELTTNGISRDFNPEDMKI